VAVAEVLIILVLELRVLLEDQVAAGLLVLPKTVALGHQVRDMLAVLEAVLVIIKVAVVVVLEKLATPMELVLVVTEFLHQLLVLLLLVLAVAVDQLVMELLTMAVLVAVEMAEYLVQLAQLPEQQILAVAVVAEPETQEIKTEHLVVPAS
jgi:hypothetical protein